MSTERLVYVVDDDDAVRRSAAFMLRHAGFKVVPVESGVAQHECSRTAYRVIVIDYID